MFLADCAVPDQPTICVVGIRPLPLSIRYRNSMDAEKTIAEIKLLEHIFTLPDKRPIQMADWKAANRKHDETYASNPWFRLWRRDGVSSSSGHKP